MWTGYRNISKLNIRFWLCFSPNDVFVGCHDADGSLVISGMDVILPSRHGKALHLDPFGICQSSKQSIFQGYTSSYRWYYFCSSRPLHTCPYSAMDFCSNLMNRGLAIRSLSQLTSPDGGLSFKVLLQWQQYSLLIGYSRGSTKLYHLIDWGVQEMDTP